MTMPCEFYIFRYVPDLVKGEFINFGVLLREVSGKPGGGAATVRFTRDWSRVRALYPDANIAMLEDLELEIASRLRDEAFRPLEGDYPKRILATLLDTCATGIQISEPQACLAENLPAQLDALIRVHVDPLKASRFRRERSGRAAIFAAMRTKFGDTGAWHFMQKNVPAAQYTRAGDPLKLDCGYAVEVPAAERSASSGREDIIRIFHAVSLRSDVDAARSLAFTAPQLRDGAKEAARIHCRKSSRPWVGLDFNLSAVVESIRNPSDETDDEDEASMIGHSDQERDLYLFGIFTMQSAGIHVLTTKNLAAAAETARIELRI